MNTRSLRELVRLFEASSLTLLDITQGEEHYILQRACPKEALSTPGSAAAQFPPAPAPAVPDAGPDFNRIIEVTSPTVGVFYAASGPGAKPYVQPGDSVRKGDVLCLVEVMKQITQVTAPQDGRVADVCVTDGTVVEFGQTLIKLY